MVLNKAYQKVRDYGTLVMFSHTIFSLSFALISMLIAAHGMPSASVFLWISVCFLGARTGANAINRVIDAKIDAQNARTATRQLPQGLMKASEVIVFTIGCFVVMVYGAYQLNWVCFFLSPVALVFLIGYSYTKRFTWLCHLVLGFTSAMAPAGAWLAITGKLSFTPILIGAANTFWVAGFDILYGAQDYAFDTSHGIHSIPAEFGVSKALTIAKGFHFFAWSALLTLGVLSEPLGIVYYSGLGIIAVLFVIQHKMVSEDNLSMVKVASYSVNQLISIVFLLTGLLDLLWF